MSVNASKARDPRFWERWRNSGAVGKTVFRLLGYDSFEGGPNAFYPVGRKYASLEQARQAARSRLQVLERTQPTSESGGQGGIQDYVFIVRPDGSMFRVRSSII